MASAARHIYPDGLFEPLPRQRAAFIKEIRVLPQSSVTIPRVHYIVFPRRFIVSTKRLTERAKCSAVNTTVGINQIKPQENCLV